MMSTLFGAKTASILASGFEGKHWTPCLDGKTDSFISLYCGDSSYIELPDYRHHVTCGSKPGFGGIFSCFGPFLLHVICP